jgi:hypothetical protein
LIVLLHGEALADSDDGYIFRVGSAQAEGDGAIGGDLGRVHGGASTGLGECGERDQGGNDEGFHRDLL